MKKRLLRITLSVVAGLGVLALGLRLLGRALGDHEPRYQGESFAYWCGQLDSPEPGASNRADAVVQTVIIPNLTRQMFADTNDSRLRVGLVDLLNGLPGIQIDFTSATGRRVSAVNNLAALGPRAKVATPALLTALQLADDSLCEPAATALVGIHADPDAVIPALIRCLQDSQGRGRPDVVEALGEFGPKARAAVPVLVRLLQDRSSKDIMVAVPKALSQIDPEAAAKAGVNPARLRSAGH